MDQRSTRKRSAVHNFAPTATKFCVMWEGQALPHDTKFGNSRCEIVGKRVIFIWSLIQGSSWSGLIKAEPVDLRRHLAHYVTVMLAGSHLGVLSSITMGPKICSQLCRVFFVEVICGFVRYISPIFFKVASLTRKVWLSSASGVRHWFRWWLGADKAISEPIMGGILVLTENSSDEFSR